MKIVIRDREAGNIIESFDSWKKAVARLEEFEKQDKVEGVYEEDFYEIARIDDDGEPDPSDEYRKGIDDQLCQ